MQNQKESTATMYTLGHAPKEIQRLMTQGQLLSPFTQQVLVDAGITKGMKVLDIGCGPGDVSLIAAELVGETGSVLGVDMNTSVLHVAQERAQAAGLKHVSFLARNVSEYMPDQEYDAIVGRLILLYVPDHIAVLRRLLGHLRPGGVVAFQEYDLSPRLELFYPPSPLTEYLWSLVTQSFQRTGAELQMGLKLSGALQEAGLPKPHLRCEIAMGSGPEWAGYEVLADVVRAVLPVIVKFGLAAAEEIEIETLADRLREENSSQQGVALMPPLISAWTRRD